MGAGRGEARQWLEDHLLKEHGDECVEWPFGVRHSGYGGIRIDGVKQTVTRVVLERTGRPVPLHPNNYALHSCDNKLCVNPKHLRWGTAGENVADRVKRGRSAGVLREHDVRLIRSRHQSGNVTQEQLGEEFGVSTQHINRIVRRKRWRHLP